MSFIKYFLLLIFSFFVSCTSSSINSRFNKSINNEIERDSTSRFTSANDEKTYKNEFDEDPIEEHPIDVKEFVAENKPKQNISKNLTDREKLMMEIVRYLNTPYQYGGNSGKGIDCSAFTKNVFKNSIHVELPRTASEQFEIGQRISNKFQPKFGDLVFFNTTKNSYPGHVGIFLGNDLFAHASFSRGVTVSSLKSNYFDSRYIGARRVTNIN